MKHTDALLKLLCDYDFTSSSSSENSSSSSSNDKSDSNDEILQFANTIVASMDACSAEFLKECTLASEKDEEEFDEAQLEAAQAFVRGIVDQSFRSFVSERMQESGKQGPWLPALLDLSIMLATMDSPMASLTLPFFILDDVLESQTVDECEETWALVESRRDALSQPAFIPSERITKSKLALLATANSLLRRLSRARRTEFCGRIIMFLAYAYPLSERSGVNFKGAINISNLTEEECPRNVPTNSKRDFSKLPALISFLKAKASSFP